jgi:hypothetical protein
MNSRQQQRGGPASQQIQVAGDLVVVEFDEKRAIDIAREQAELVIQEFTAEAESAALERIDSFSRKLIENLAELDLLNAFSDPAFQILLKKTQLHAAATAEDSDHELLSKLLSERAGGHSKPMHMVITRAVEVVEQIDSAALRGILFLWFASKITPSDAEPKSGFARIDDMVAKLSEGEDLPTGTGWLQRLDLMSYIRYSPPGLQSMHKWHDILLKTTPGYACEGIAPSDVDAVRGNLDRIIPNLSSIIGQHPFLPGYLRINAASSERLIEDLRPTMQTLGAFKAKIPPDAMDLPIIDNPLRALGSKRTCKLCSPKPE